MKIGVIFLGVMILLGILLNVFLFKLSMWHFLGLMLGMILFLGVAGNFAYKYIQKKQGVKTDSFLLPDAVSDKMKNVDLGIQYESSVVALSFLIIGIIAFDIYIVFFYEMSGWFKFFAVFNSLCGLALMLSMLTTNYQQLMSYRQSTSFINSYVKSDMNKVDYDDGTQDYYAAPPKKKRRVNPNPIYQTNERGYY